ncbi:MAG: S8 family serine peptidase [candidate division Zixibacteria bacterium]|nr:S8 family serine peptidase [candidate division Zixibacteria bacterium]
MTEKISSVEDTGFVKILIDFENRNTDTKTLRKSFSKSKSPIELYRYINYYLRTEAIRNSSGIESTVDSLSNEGQLRNYKPFWIASLAFAEAKRDGVIVLEKLPGVEFVGFDLPVTTIKPVMMQGASGFSTGVENGLQAIGATDAWEMGYNGYGSVVCNIDTGVDANHPALVGSFRGNHGYPAGQCWFDPYTNTTYPVDSRGHGTHTMGIMVGYAGSDTIGVAPAAQWIAAGAVDRGGDFDRTISDIIASFQWAADPDDNPETSDDIPDVINNSWGIPRGVYPECDDTFWEVIDNCEALGIVCVFAAGNEGPEPQTLRSPADRAGSLTSSFAVGAVDGNTSEFPITIFSSRGPSGCDGVSLKPQVVAPGLSVRSSHLNNSYVYLSGTSMAAPHVSGAAAILRQAKPDATVEEIKFALMNSATDLGENGADYDYGYGIINIPAAIDYLLNPTGVADEITYNDEIPGNIVLHGNHPNPFNAGTEISFELKTSASINLTIYNLLGERVKILLNEYLAAGNHEIFWDGSDNHGNPASSGIYFYRLSTPQGNKSKRMTIIK